MKDWHPLKLEELSGDTQKVYDILNQESDLACVLIGTSYLAELLASIIETSFIETSVSKKLFDPQRGAVGGFATRADLAYCLGLINKDFYKDLMKVAEIRNVFAHKHLALDFGDSTIRKYCQELQAWRKLGFKLSQEQMQPPARFQFNISVILIGSGIHVDALSLGRGNQTRNRKWPNP